MEDFKNITFEDTLSRELEDFPGEEWKEIKGYEGMYLISNLGRVKSLVGKEQRILKKTISSARYQVILYSRRKGYKSFLTGRLTASYFNREPSFNEVLIYKDKNQLFDAFFNLNWITKKDSSKAAFYSGNFPSNHGRGLNNGMTKIKEGDVLEIRRKKSEGLTIRQLSNEYKLHVNSIKMIVRGKRWQHPL